MAFDQENHTIDPVTGFQVHKETGHHIGMNQAPIERVNDDPDWPKWVTPHESHVMRQKTEGAPDHVSTRAFPHSHVNRADGSVTVLVADENEEKLALGEYRPPAPSHAGE